MIDAALGGLETVLGRLNGAVLFVFRWLALVLLAVMTAIVLSGVFFRYVLDDALPWSEEIAKFLMVWMTFVAAPLAFKSGALVAIQAVPEALKGRAREYLLIFIQAIIISLMVVFIDKGAFLTQNAVIQRASSVDVSIAYVYFAMPLGALMILLVALQFLVGSLRRIASAGAARPEGA